MTGSMTRNPLIALSAAVLATLGAPAAALAQNAAPGEQPPAAASAPAPVLGASRHLLKASAVDETYVIDVLPLISPFRPPAPGEKLPVVYVLDGNLFFPMVASTATVLTLEDIPSVLVVGIGYDLAPAPMLGLSLLEIQARRARDLTPTPDPAFLAQMEQTYAGFGGVYPDYGRPGGAQAFLGFINEELKPFIAAHYPEADPYDATLAGDSFGGLFALYALFNAPESFNRYVVGSPSLFWGEHILFEHEAVSGDASARLFLSAGSLEPEDQMLAPVRKMHARLSDSRRPNLDYTFHVFEGETHGSVLPATFSRGLRVVFE